MRRQYYQFEGRRVSSTLLPILCTSAPKFKTIKGGPLFPTLNSQLLSCTLKPLLIAQHSLHNIIFQGLVWPEIVLLHKHDIHYACQFYDVSKQSGQYLRIHAVVPPIIRPHECRHYRFFHLCSTRYVHRHYLQHTLTCDSFIRDTTSQYAQQQPAQLRPDPITCPKSLNNVICTSVCLFIKP